MPMNILCPRCEGHTYPTGTHGDTLKEGEAEYRCRNCRHGFTARSPNKAGTFAPESNIKATDGQTREELYNQAKNLGIEGRSSMTKDELRKALAEAESA